MRRFVLIPALGLLLSLGAGSAHAQQYDNRGVYDRIDRLERDLQVMQSQVSRGGGSTVITSPALGGGGRAPVGAESAPLPSGMASRLDDRVDQLEDMVRQLTGKLEESQFRTGQLAKQLERMQADIDLRFKELQGGAAGAQAPAGQPALPLAGGDKANLTAPKGADAPGPAPGPQVLGTMPEKDMKRLLPNQTAAPAAAQPAAPAKALDPQAQYDAAYAAAQSGDYASAEKGFQDFLSKNPSHQLAGNAQYWLGDIAYSKKDFGTSAATFLDAYKKYPKHSKAPDMIYKAGSSFGLLGKKKEACTAFGILFADHPQMPDRVKRAAVAEKQKYECK